MASYRFDSRTAFSTKRKSPDIYRQGFLFALHSVSHSRSLWLFLFVSENEKENEDRTPVRSENPASSFEGGPRRMAKSNLPQAPIS